MRIAFYAPMKPPGHLVPSGDRRMARLFLAALAAAGHDARVASRLRSWDDGRTPGRAAAIARRGRARAAALAAGLQGGGWRPDLWFTYHCYHKAPDHLGPAVADALAIPYVIAEASHAPKQAAGRFAAGFRTAEAAIRRADAVLAMTVEDRAGLAAIVAPDRLHAFSPFVDTGPFHSADRAAAHRRWFGDADGPWLLTVAMMRPGDKQRGYARLADALHRLDACAPDRPWRLAVAGDGPARETIAAALPHPRCRLLGRIAADDLPDLYAAADLFVWPGANEAYGLVFLEAQAAGLGVVATAERAAGELVADGETGLLVPPNDADALATALARLLDDPALRRRMGRTARDRSAGFDLAAASRRLGGLLHPLIGGSPS